MTPSLNNIPGFLHGLPIVIKDLTDVKGVKTTYGSTIYKNHVPTESDYLVQRIEYMGGIVIGKSNTPEFGAGSQTFNKVFGATSNPWNNNYTSGGSSGGTAAALAAGSAWLGTGSDLGGSLRNPASFCGVVGLRPTPGIVPHGPTNLPFDIFDLFNSSKFDEQLLFISLNSFTKEIKSSFFATKSVSQFTSINDVLTESPLTTITPSLASLDIFFEALVIPLILSISAALSRSPFDSFNAALQSLNPAPVDFLNCFIFSISLIILFYNIYKIINLI